MNSSLLVDQFQLSMRFEFAAVFLFAVTGALRAIDNHYDFVGVFMLALLSAIGGGLVRDAIFLTDGAPQFLRDARYLYVVSAATLVCLLVGSYINRFRQVFLLADALGLGIYAVVGTQRGLDVGLPIIAAGLVGLSNAVGGGVLRDLLTGKETLLFKPGQFYVLAAVIGTSVFLALLVAAHTTAREAAFWSIGTTFALRFAAVTFNWQTRAARPLFGQRAPQQP